MKRKICHSLVTIAIVAFHSTVVTCFNLESSQTVLVADFAHQMGTGYSKNKSHTKDLLYINYVCELLKRDQYSQYSTVTSIIEYPEKPTTRARRDIGSEREAGHHNKRRILKVNFKKEE